MTYVVYSAPATEPVTVGSGIYSIRCLSNNSGAAKLQFATLKITR